MAREDYEFSARDSQTLAAAARWMGLLGWTFVVAGILVGAPVVAGQFLYLPGAAFLVVAGLLTARASRSFRLVTTTEGNDVGHLLDAIDALRRLYRMQVLVIAVVFVIVALIGFLGYLAT